MLSFTLFVQLGWLCRGSIDFWGQERRFHYQYWTSEIQYEALLLYILANRWHYQAVYKIKYILHDFNESKYFA
jgi:hypothetical protein